MTTPLKSAAGEHGICHTELTVFSMGSMEQPTGNKMETEHEDSGSKF